MTLLVAPPFDPSLAKGADRDFTQDGISINVMSYSFYEKMWKNRVNAEVHEIVRDSETPRWRTWQARGITRDPRLQTAGSNRQGPHVGSLSRSDSIQALGIRKH